MMIKIIKFIILLFFKLSLLYPQSWYMNQFDEEGIGNCGPTSAAMVIKLVTGRNVTITECRNIIGYNKEDGSTIVKEIEQILDFYGIKSRRVYTLKDYHGEIAIIPLTMKYISNKKIDYIDGHYIVAYGLYENLVFINDPLNGANLRYDINEIEQGLNSYYLIIDNN